MTQYPTTIIICGITGDLSQKKILPALFDLFLTHKLPQNIRIVGFSRREMSLFEARDFVRGFLPKDESINDFLDLISYVSGQFDDSKSYTRLAEHLHDIDQSRGGCSNTLFYFSVPPTLYEIIATQLSLSGLSVPCGGADGFSRMLIEKPFGNDLVTAQHLDTLLGKLFKEEQIFRIDHYLAKESLYNIINLHRKEKFLEQKWNNTYIKKVRINLFEKSTVASRGAFYDGVGTLRDVGQNHILQMLALVAMNMPSEFTPEHIREARTNVLEHLEPASQNDIEKMFRGQYDGYLDEVGVLKDSKTETFFFLTTFVHTQTFANIPFILSAGKALDKNLTEVIVECVDGMKIVFNVPPENSLPAYQKILLDCIAGDQTVFQSTREVMAEWKYITPIVEKVSQKEPIIYKQGSSPESIVL